MISIIARDIAGNAASFSLPSPSYTPTKMTPKRDVTLCRSPSGHETSDCAQPVVITPNGSTRYTCHKHETQNQPLAPRFSTQVYFDRIHYNDPTIGARRAPNTNASSNSF